MLEAVTESVNKNKSSLECNPFPLAVIYDIWVFVIAPNLREISVLTLENDRFRERQSNCEKR